MERSEAERSGAESTVARLYKAARLLFKDFDSYLSSKAKQELVAYEQYQRLYPEPVFTYTFPTVMDWVGGNYKAKLEQKLKVVYKKSLT